jgi:protein SCO1/2
VRRRAAPRALAWLAALASLAPSAAWPAPPAVAASSPAASAAAASLFSANFDGTRLVDQEGRRFDASALAGRIVLFNFIYTGCSSTCPLQTHALAQVQQQLPARLRGQVRFVSVSLDPVTDTPQALKAYARRMGADLSGWSFLTGHSDDVDRLSARLRLFREDATPRRLEQHATNLWLVDRSGRLVQRYSGNPPDVGRLLRDLAALE